MASGRSGQLIFSGTSRGGAAASKIRFNWSETYEISSNSSILSIDSVEVSSPIWADSMARMSGDLYVDGMLMLRFRVGGGEYGRVTIQKNNAWSPVYVKSDRAQLAGGKMEIRHEASGRKTITVSLVGSGGAVDGYPNFAICDSYLSGGSGSESSHSGGSESSGSGSGYWSNGSFWDWLAGGNEGTNGNSVGSSSSGGYYYATVATFTSGQSQTVELTTIPKASEIIDDSTIFDESNYGIQNGLEVIVLNATFTPIFIIDNYESLIWTVRYGQVGDFELYMEMNTELFQDLTTDTSYFMLEESDRLMIPESWEIVTDLEEGDKLIIKGRSLESTLERRIIIQQSPVLEGSEVQDVLLTMLYENCVEPNDAARILWPNMSLSRSSSVTGYTMSGTFYGSSVLDAITTVCEEFSLGFKLTRNVATGKIEFLLYAGLDRSANQTERPYVVFSPEYDNLISSDYTIDTSTFRNVAIVSGQAKNADGGNSVSGTTLTLGSETKGLRPERTVGEASGLDRYEVFVDASGLSWSTQEPSEDGQSLKTVDVTEEEYAAMMDQEGENQLAASSATKNIEASVDPERTFVFGRDYFLGDIIYIENQYGVGARARVVEVVFSQDANGEVVYPTFDIQL